MSGLRDFWARLTGKTADQRSDLLMIQLDRLARDLESAAQIAAMQAQDVRRKLAQALETTRTKETDTP